MTAPDSGSLLRLSGIHVYPIKSAAGFSPATWEVDAFGLRYDRRWMVTDADGRFLSQRTHPRLALVQPSLGPETLRINAPGMPALELPLRPADTSRTSVVVWQDTCAAVPVGRRAHAWFSDVLGTDCRLVYMPDDTLRGPDPAYAGSGEHRVSFADAFPFLLISEESLADLNARLETSLPMNRFRPNLVIAGEGAFAEDRIAEFRIGAVRFRTVKPCDRCVVTTTDQQTGTRGVEPLRTLATYRRWDGRVFFGQNVLHVGRGRLQTGDPVTCCLEITRCREFDGA